MEALLSTRARRTTSSAIRDLLRVTGDPEVLSLAGGMPAPELFPLAELRAIADELLADPVLAASVLQYGPTEGDGDLRAQLAHEAGVEPEQVVVTTGSQQALDLVGRVLLDPGDVVVVESPAYVGALQVFAGAGARIERVPVDEHGLDTDRLRTMLTLGLRPKLCYVVPNFSNPTGVTMSVERRRTLAALAERYGFVVVEDDPYGALRFSGEALPPLRAFGANVVSLGSASKTLVPGLRVGWAVLARELVGPLLAQKQSMDLHTSTLAQRIVACARCAPWYPEHLSRLQVAYAERASTLCDALAAQPDVFTPVVAPAGGLFVWTAMRPELGIDTTALLSVAVDHGVAYVPGAAFATGAASARAMRLSFATCTPDELRTGVVRLVAAIQARVTQEPDRAGPRHPLATR